MSIDYNALRSLSESEIREALYKISLSMGMSEEKARRAASAAPSVKKMLGSASDSQLEKIANGIKGKNAESILSDIKGDSK